MRIQPALVVDESRESCQKRRICVSTHSVLPTDRQTQGSIKEVAEDMWLAATKKKTLQIWKNPSEREFARSYNGDNNMGFSHSHFWHT